MRGKDFDAVALVRIKRAFDRNDAAHIGGYLIENYSQTVKNAACEALGALSSAESLKELLCALFYRKPQKETEAQIIKTLSFMLTKEDLARVRALYALCAMRPMHYNYCINC